MTPKEAKEHQDMIKANIAFARESGDEARAEYLENVFAPLLAIKLDE